MKVVAKFATAFLIATCVCLAVFTWVHAHVEARDLHASVTSDLQSFGERLRDGIVATWESSGDSHARSLVQATSGSRGGVSVVWLSPMENEETLVAGHSVSVRLPVRVRDAAVGTLILRKQVVQEADLLKGTLPEALGFMAAFALVLWMAAVLVGGAVIGKPLQRIVRQAERVGAGDLSHRLRPDRADEIGDLKRSLNAMCDALSRARENLEREAAARVEALEQLRHMDRLRTVGTMASSLAHELGTPLNVILLRSQAIADGEVEGSELAETGQTIAAQVEKMSKVVRQILDFSRRAPVMGIVHLRDVARAAADLLHLLAKKADVAIEVSVEQDAVVQGDGVALEQALTNLIVNGIYAMPEGGTLHVTVGENSQESGPLRDASGSWAYVDVKDEGRGIADDELSRIFEPFYTTRPKGEGTGLGLSVARGIAEEHGGHISAQSELGRGSTFRISIPKVSG